MKKLLSLLSVLTISGTAIPTTIAASPYQKNQLNSHINLQTNNLENLKRNKREIDHENEMIESSNLSISFTPNFWEEVIFLYYV